MENKNVVEMHGCFVGAKVLNVLAVYTPAGKLVDCAVTSLGDHRVAVEHQPLVACDTHTTAEIESAYKRWKSRNGKDSHDEDDDN